jgi:hypothetical protein
MSRYTDDEAKEILRRALEHDSANAGRLHHEDLVEAAREVGIPPELVEAAALDLTEEQEALRVLEKQRRKRKRRYWRGLGVFAIVGAFLYALDALTPGGPWFYFPLLAWGLFVVLRGYFVLLPPSKEKLAEDVGRERQRLRRIRAKEEARRRKQEERERRKNAPLEFERAVQGGVNALLDAIARQLEGPPPTRSQRREERREDRQEREQRRAERRSEFEDYVAGRKSGAPARGQRTEAPKRPDSAMRKEPLITPAPPRARVELDEEEDELSGPRSRRSSHRR